MSTPNALSIVVKPGDPGMFTKEIVDAILLNEGGNMVGIPGLAAKYNSERKYVPGAPLIEELLPEHTAAVVGISTFQPDPDKDWDGLVARYKEYNDFLYSANNPFFPRWYGKTEDTPSVWTADTGDLKAIDSLNQQKINQLFYTWQRPTGGRATEIFKPAPCADPEVMYSIVCAAKQFVNILVKRMGNETGDNADFRYSTTLPILCSLGYDAFREFCTHVGMHSDETDFVRWAAASDDEITTDLRKAAAISGYPVNLGHVDCHDMIVLLENCKLLQAPRWLPSLILLHILKHVRYYQNLNGKPYLFAAYRGRHGFIPLNEDGLNMPMGLMSNQSVLRALQYILRLSSGGKEKTPCEVAIAGVLNQIVPSQLTEPIPLRNRPDIIVAPGIRIYQYLCNQHETKRRWIDPGIAIHNVARFDPKSGTINKNAAVTDELAMSLEWPLNPKATADDLRQWISDLPSKVTPSLPGDIVFGWIRNVNPLGHPRGLFHLYNGFMIVNMIRTQLFGCDFGSVLSKEYPPLWALPMGSTMEETTNQGKTNFCRVSAKVFAPQITETQCSGSASAPMQRSAASQIEIFGTAIYDEFSPPKSPEHFLHAQGFVSLCTGGSVNPGRAMENAAGLRLRYSLFLAAKAGPDVEDAKNRSFMVFLDQLTDENRCPDNLLNKIMTGSSSAIIRLSMLLWIYQNKIIERVRKLELISGKWRFNATLTIIKMLAGDEYPEVEKYLEASAIQCDIQRDEVAATSIMSELGHKEKFNPMFYFMNCDDEVLNGLAYKCKASGPIRMLDLLRILVEDNGNRVFSIELSKKSVEESGATSMFTRALTKVPFKRGVYTITLSETKVKTEYRTWTRSAMVTREDALEPLKIPDTK